MDPEEEHTYYLSKVLKKTDSVPALQKSIRQKTGFLGKQFLQTPMLSDKFKLKVLKKTHPEYMRYIDAVEKTLPYVQKMDKFQDTMGKFHDKHLKPRDADAEEEYKKYSYTNRGGKYKTKTNKRKQKNKRNQKNKTKRR
jgi:hypothetical protein